MQSQFLDRPSTEAEKENEFEIEEFSMTEDERQKRKTKLNTLYPAGSLAYNRKGDGGWVSEQVLKNNNCKRTQ